MTIKSGLIALPLMFLGWLCTLIIVGLMSDAAPASVVMFPTQVFLQTLPEDSAILSANRFSVTLTSERAGFSRALYQHGAWLVLPAGLPGCLPLPETAQSF